MKQFTSRSDIRQKGFVLPVGMIMLAVLTIIGIGTMRDTAVQEKMAQNYIDKEKSFQAAESALRIAQRISLRTSYENIASTDNFHSTSKLPSGAPDYEAIDWVNNPNWGWDVNQVEINDPALADRPRAMIEEMQNTASLKVGKEKKNEELAERYYRVTAFAVGETESARTTLQGVIVQE